MEEVRRSDFLEPYEIDVLGHIIPCCRADKNKMDFIDNLHSLGQLSQQQIELLQQDVLFDQVQAASTAALTKSVHELHIH